MRLAGGLAVLEGSTAKGGCTLSREPPRCMGGATAGLPAVLLSAPLLEVAASGCFGCTTSLSATFRAYPCADASGGVRLFLSTFCGTAAILGGRTASAGGSLCLRSGGKELSRAPTSAPPRHGPLEWLRVLRGR